MGARMNSTNRASIIGPPFKVWIRDQRRNLHHRPATSTSLPNVWTATHGGGATRPLPRNGGVEELGDCNSSLE